MTPEAKKAKDYLQRVYELDEKIKKKEQRIEFLESEIGRITPVYSDMPPSNNNSDKSQKLNEYIEKKIFLEKQIGRFKAEKMKRSAVFEKQIDMLEKEKYRDILKCRFIECMTWEKIADKLDYLNARSVPPVCNRALENFYQKNQDFFKNGA